MFKKSTTTKQLDLFTSPSNLMCVRENRNYDNPAAWHNKFYREVTCNNDEDIFRPQFAKERKGMAGMAIPCTHTHSHRNEHP